MGVAGKIWFATFDFSDDIAKGIQDGTIQFAIDQQPYLQGYIPVAVLAIVKKDHVTDPKQIEEKLKADPKFQKRLSDYGLQPVYDPTTIRSGPSFITKDNFDKVVKFAGQYR
jgi:simple sugar transport system substrate-binding protein